MKRQVLLSVLAAIAIFAVSATAEAGMFGRLSLLRGGCSPCGEVGCEPCEPACCQPCEPACCEPVCDPCGACDTGCHKPFRPFGGFFMNLKHKMSAKFNRCGACEPACCEPVGCEPCEPACCQPCEPACCEPVCDPCGACDTGCHKPFRPFGGFFMNLKHKMSAKFNSYGGCSPCEPACCEPVCDPCAACCN